jgi:hypothetical protein
MNIFRKKSITKHSEVNSKQDELKSCPKYDKPKIMLIDMPEKTAEVLSNQGYNVSVGSFGSPYKVPQSDSYQPVICNGHLPNVTEQEIVIIDLDEPAILKEPKGEKHTSDGEEDWWASCNQGVIDPRPRGMAIHQKSFDRILSHGGLFVIFAKNRETQKMKFGRIAHYGLEGRNIDYDNWSFLSCLNESCIEINYDSGKEMFCADKKNILSGLLETTIKDSTFCCTLQRGYNINEPTWVPLLKNKYESTVSVAIARAYKEDKYTWILIFPQFNNKADFVLDLFQLLPNLSLHLFPYYEGNLWLHKQEYELPGVNRLEEEKKATKQKCDGEIGIINSKIEKEKEENKYWYDLIRETGDPLVQAVIKTLHILGFEQVVDVDKESRVNGTSGSLREDIQIKDKSPILIVDVKGIIDLPSDAEATQAHRHATMRMKEWDRTDINCLTIINHQRNIPPLDRENNRPYRQELLDGASQIDSGLMTAWDLYRLLRSFLRNKWNTENIKPLFYKSQRISIIPTNYKYVGKIEQIWKQAEAFSVIIEGAILENPDKIGIETEIEIVEFTIASLKLNDQTIKKAEMGNEIGVKTNQFPNNIKKGMHVYKVF